MIESEKEAVYEQILGGHIPYQFLYDDVGNLLYERLCTTPEYYLARAENELLARYFANLKGDDVTIVDLGCGDGRKAIHSLESLDMQTVRYVGIDSSSAATAAAEQRISHAFPDMDTLFRVESIFSGIESIAGLRKHGPVVLCFLGSTIGNFSHQQRLDFFQLVQNNLLESDRFLTAFDLVKPVNRLKAAYNDATRFAALAGLNMVCQINQLFGWDMPLSSFEHQVFYDEKEHIIQPRLVAVNKISVSDAATKFQFELDAGDYLIANSAQKFELDGIRDELKSIFASEPNNLVQEDFRYALTEVVI